MFTSHQVDVVIANKLRVGPPHWRPHPDNPLDPEWRQYLVHDEGKVVRSTEHNRQTQLEAKGDVNKEQAAALVKGGAFDDFGAVGSLSSQGSGAAEAAEATEAPGKPKPKPKAKPNRNEKLKFDINAKADEIAEDKIADTVGVWAQHLLADIGEANKLMEVISDVAGCEGMRTQLELHLKKLGEARSEFTAAKREPTRQQLKASPTPCVLGFCGWFEVHQNCKRFVQVFQYCHRLSQTSLSKGTAQEAPRTHQRVQGPGETSSGNCACGCTVTEGQAKRKGWFMNSWRSIS